MASTTSTAMRPDAQEQALPMRWRAWPLVDQPRWSWLVVAGMLGAGVLVWVMSGSRLLALAAVVGLAITLWQFLLPVRYEITSIGLRRDAVGRSRLIPWHAVRAYQLRPTGIVLHQRGDATAFDLLGSLFVPYPPDEDDMLCAIREHLSHATEVPA